MNQATERKIMSMIFVAAKADFYFDPDSYIQRTLYYKLIGRFVLKKTVQITTDGTHELNKVMLYSISFGSFPALYRHAFLFRYAMLCDNQEWGLVRMRVPAKHLEELTESNVSELESIISSHAYKVETPVAPPGFFYI